MEEVTGMDRIRVNNILSSLSEELKKYHFMCFFVELIPLSKLHDNRDKTIQYTLLMHIGVCGTQSSFGSCGHSDSKTDKHPCFLPFFDSACPFFVA